MSYPLILKEPNQLLHKQCELVNNFNDARKISGELLTVMKSITRFWNRWLGFAANQIGSDKRIIVIRMGKSKYEIMVNPVVIEKRFPFPYLETCYSINGRYLVKRYLWAKVKYQDLKSNWHEIVLKGPSAIYQEIDHINGILVSEIGLRIL